MKEKRLIDADALLEDGIRVSYAYNNDGIILIPMGEVRQSIKNAPTIDAVPVVRCKDCENWDTDWGPAGAEDGEHFCLVFAYTSRPDDFCSHGERRCDNDTP